MTFDRLQSDLANFLHETGLVHETTTTSTRANDIAKVLTEMIQRHPDMIMECWNARKSGFREGSRLAWEAAREIHLSGVVNGKKIYGGGYETYDDWLKEITGVK